MSTYRERLNTIRIAISAERAKIEELHSEIRDIEDADGDNDLTADELENIFCDIDEIEDRMIATAKDDVMTRS